MINLMWTKAPADLLGRGGIDMRGAFGPGLCSGFSEYLTASADAPIATAPGTGLSAGSTAVRRRPATQHAIGDVVVMTTFVQNNGTTLGNLAPGRPQS